MNVFNDKVLHEIRITIGPTYWFDTLTTDYNNHRINPDLYPEIARPCILTFDGVTLDTIGIRQRGNSSNRFFNYYKFKKPFKLEIDAFKNIKLDGLKNIILNNCTDDPSYVREALCYKLIRDEGLPAPRTSYAKVYINNQYWGLYMLVENVDKTFLKDKYGGSANNGNLYKTAQTGQAYLHAINIGDTLHKKKTGLELKTNETINDWSRLVNFINLLNNSDKPYFRDSLLKYFDVNSYLTLLAIEKLVYSWDSYWANGNNYYMYEHPDGTIRWISWDMNETFPNINGFDISRLTGSSYLLPTDRYDSRPLIKAVFSTEEWKNRYYDIVCGFLNKQFRAEYIDTTILRWHQLIEQAVYDDTNKLYSYESFSASLTGEEINADFTFPRTGFRLKRNLPGIIPFIHDRREWIRKQISLLDHTCEFAERSNNKYPLYIFPNPAFQNTLNLSWDGTADGLARVQLINLEGKLVADLFNQRGTNNKLQTEIEYVPAGVYWVIKIDSDGSMGSGKWVKF
ncbi:MAG: CotH kinase family protein [Bacteroidota bacterium]|nr:CotH kinase family protein [Bacteroidota bacterium]